MITAPPRQLNERRDSTYTRAKLEPLRIGQSHHVTAQVLEGHQRIFLCTGRCQLTRTTGSAPEEKKNTNICRGRANDILTLNTKSSLTLRSRQSVHDVEAEGGGAGLIAVAAEVSASHHHHTGRIGALLGVARTTKICCRAIGCSRGVL